jgi:hypothetical protein
VPGYDELPDADVWRTEGIDCFPIELGGRVVLRLQRGEEFFALRCPHSAPEAGSRTRRIGCQGYPGIRA